MLSAYKPSHEEDCAGRRGPPLTPWLGRGERADGRRFLHAAQRGSGRHEKKNSRAPITSGRLHVLQPEQIGLLSPSPRH